MPDHIIKKISKTILIITVCFLFALSFSGCSHSSSYSEETVSEFASAIANKNFSDAYKYLWDHAGRPSEESFVSDYEYMVESLGITDITIKDLRVDQKSESNIQMKYTAVLNCKTAGTILSDCSSHVVVDNNETYIAYTRSFLISDFEAGDRIITTSLQGKRGEILSSDGEVIAENNYADTVYVVPSEVEDISYTISCIGMITELNEKDIEKAKKNFETAVKKEYGTSVIAAYPHNSIDEQTEQELLLIDGVYVDRTSLTPERYYPYKNIFSHVAGYANTPNSDAQIEFIEEGGYSDYSIYGKEGIEKSYNDKLLAKDGLRVSITDENFGIKKVLYEESPTNGRDIVLTIDSDLQSRAYYSMHDNLTTAQSGVAIVMDYSTAAVHAMVSYPSFDPNLFSYSISTEDYKALFEAEGTDQPLYSRATLGLYPPGSIIKPFIAGTALDKGVITTNTAFPYTITNNVWQPQGWTGKGITRSYDSGTPLVLNNALVKSDNIYFSWVGMKMGEDLLFSSLENIGFSKEYEFDVPVSTSNLINEGTEVKEFILADTAIGHGEMLVTPIQIAALYTAFTNSGDTLKPYLVDSILTADGNGNYTKTFSAEKQILNDNVISTGAVSVIRDGLRGVVTAGTAKAINLKDRKVFSKTGTAIKSNNSDQRISWVCAWTEDTDDPRLVLVMVDGPSDIDDIKFEIAKDLLK